MNRCNVQNEEQLMIKELREIRRDRERNGRETNEGERRREQNEGDFPELHEHVLEDREQNE